MLGALGRPSNFVRPSFTLPGLVGAFLDPIVIVAVLVACAAAFGQPPSPPLVILAVLAFVLSFPGNVSFYERPRRVARKVLTNWLLFVVILGTFGYVTRYVHVFPQAMLTAWGIATPAALIAAHFLMRLMLPQVVAFKHNQTTAVVAGVNEVSTRLLEQLRDNPYLGTRIVAFFDDRSGERLKSSDNVPVLGRLSELA